MQSPESFQPNNPFRLKSVTTPEMQESPAPRLEGKEAERVLRLETNDDAALLLNDLLIRDPGRLGAVLLALAGRDLKNELPADEKDFNYRRNLKECASLQRIVKRIATKTTIDPRKEEDMVLLIAASKLLSLELKKADWLGAEFYPEVFGRTIATAIGEVNQFLIKEKNLRILDRFTDPNLTSVSLKDDLRYLIEGGDLDSAGNIRGYAIEVRMPETYTDRDEWKVYNVLIHEILHYVSYQDRRRTGMHDPTGNPEYKELNEAVTEILAFTIANRHLEKGKTPLKGERQQPNTLDKRPYGEYTIYVKQLFKKIPLETFIDAMLNRGGMERLRQKFAEAFGDERALMDFGKKLRDMYLPPEERKARNAPPETQEEPKGQLIPMRRKHRAAESADDTE